MQQFFVKSGAADFRNVAQQIFATLMQHSL
jgi:hypothetical protein